jgi:hypothetical protein
VDRFIGPVIVVEDDVEAMDEVFETIELEDDEDAVDEVVEVIEPEGDEDTVDEVVEIVELEVDKDAVDETIETVELLMMYTERRLEPPHISVEFPEQIILQSVSAAAEAELPSEFPQKHSVLYSVPK